MENRLLTEDHEIGALPKHTQFKIGGFLTNLMAQNLKYKIGARDYLLLKSQKVQKDKLKF
jgi:hypothetical protein